MSQMLLFTSDADELQDELDRTHPNPRPLARRERAVQLSVFDLFEYEPRPPRPRCRSECRNGPRPCPWVGCRYHLYLDVDEETGRIRFNFPGRDPWELEHSCALDVVDAGGGDPLSLADLGELIDVGPERARQLVNEALAHAREVAEAWGLADLFDGEDE